MEFLLRKFFSNIAILALSQPDQNRFPVKVGIKLKKWVEHLSHSLVSDRFINALIYGMDWLKSQSEDLFVSLRLEMEAVVEYQDAALASAPPDGDGPESALSAPGSSKNANAHRRRLKKRAGDASASLLSSLREALDEALPGWAKGLIKVGEEVLEIYGPSSKA